jgi:hypothetical protein
MPFTFVPDEEAKSSGFQFIPDPEPDELPSLSRLLDTGEVPLSSPEAGRLTRNLALEKEGVPGITPEAISAASRLRTEPSGPGTIPKLKAAAYDVGRDTVNGLADFLNTPTGMITMGLGPVAGAAKEALVKPVVALFATTLTKGAFDQSKSAVDKFREGDIQGAATDAGNALVQAGMAGAGLRGITTKAEPTGTFGEREMAVFPVTGKVIPRRVVEPTSPAVEAVPTGAATAEGETSSASTIPSPAGASQPEVRTSVGEETPLRQSGEASGAQIEAEPNVPTQEPVANPQLEPAKPEAEAAKPAESAAIPPEVKAEVPADVGPGLGAAEYGEVQGQGDPDIYGVAERVRKQRAAAGQTVAIDPGQGVSAIDAVIHGQEVLEKEPLSAQTAVDTFRKDKSVSYDGFSAVRAKAEKAFQDARRTEEKLGTDSPEYETAKAAAVEWDKVSKEMQTEWHKTGRAQQGQTDIDTGTFTGLERAYREATDKDFTPKQKPKAEKIVKGVKKATAETAAADEAFKSEFKKQIESTNAEKRALDAANKTVREWAAKRAEAENKARVEQAKRLKEAADLQLRAVKRAEAMSAKRARDAAVRAAKEEQRNLADPSIPVWKAANAYLEKGLDSLDEIRNKVAADLGMKVDKVTRLLAQTPRLKYLMDELWKNQQNSRRLKEQAKRWLISQETPLYQRALASVPRAMFGLKVGFHGTVALGTHAPMVVFQPRFWKNYFRDFGKMYKMVGSRAYYENQVQDLMRRPNYTTARRAGLVNDPFVFEDYNSPDTAKYFGGLTGMGNRGYTVLKIIRQDMFDQHWNKLPKLARIPEVAQAIANDVNHATGVVKGKAPAGSNVALFAPRLMASRAMWLVGDPVKAIDTFARWKQATPGDKWQAMAQLKEKAWVAGTFFSLLALNQGFLAAIGSKQKINGIPEAMGGGGINPMESDFLKFKAAGLDVAYGSAMLNMAKLPARMATAIAFEGKTSKLVLEDERIYKIAGDYLRSQMSPFAGTVTDLALGRDYAGRPLPRAGFGLLPGRTDIPKRLKKHGITEPYTWKEYSSIQFTPIPISEGIREVWGQGLGMSDSQIDHYLKSFIIISVMAGTGSRVTEDWNAEK